MCAVEVAFESDLLDAYKTVLSCMCETYFKWFCELTVTELISEVGNEIDECIEFVDGLDAHAFWTNYMIWRSLNVDPSNLTFPLPPGSHLIPFQHAWWNAMKGAMSTRKMADC